MEGDLPEHAGAGNEAAETTGKAQQHKVLHVGRIYTACQSRSAS